MLSFAGKGYNFQIMKKYLLVIASLLLLAFVPQSSYAQESEELLMTEATESAEATPASILESELEKLKETDLTEPTGPARGKLEQYMLSKDPGPLGITNFLQHAMRRSVELGVPATTLVLLLLFPIVGAVIAAGRHLIGLRGFGLFTTAALSIAFLATGVKVGLIMFIFIMLVANFGRVMVRRLRLQYLPRIALLLWFVSLGIFALLSISPYLGILELITISIFPILLLVLFAETYIGARIGVGFRRSIEMTVETIVLAVICYLILSLDSLQRFAVLNPEMTVLSVAVFDIFLGKYVGLRLLEYWRFRELLS